MQPIQGIHHITVMASDPQRNIDFYTQILGQRFVKRTVNFDDNGTYHLYYGDRVGSPGTIMMASGVATGPMTWRTCSFSARISPAPSRSPG